MVDFCAGIVVGVIITTLFYLAGGDE
jgi:hypothetical protein